MEPARLEKSGLVFWKARQIVEKQILKLSFFIFRNFRRRDFGVGESVAILVCSSESRQRVFSQTETARRRLGRFWLPQQCFATRTERFCCFKNAESCCLSPAFLTQKFFWLQLDHGPQLYSRVRTQSNYSRDQQLPFYKQEERPSETEGKSSRSVVHNRQDDAATVGWIESCQNRQQLLAGLVVRIVLLSTSVPVTGAWLENFSPAE